MPIASLPMYDFPEVRDALDTIWTGFVRHLAREGLSDVPRHLSHERALHDLWTDPNLYVSQCCGYDLINRYAGKLKPLATPRYTAPGCDACSYSSVVIVGEQSNVTELDQLRGGVCVINGSESHSGMNALRALIAPLNRNGRFFSAVKATGTHFDSITLVSRGEADVAAIDCVTYAILSRYRAHALAGTRTLCYTERAPGVPYVTRADIEGDVFDGLQTASRKAFEDDDVRAAGERLFIDGVECLPLSAYAAISKFEERAVRKGYPALC